jgi:uncharacterized protein (UPF0276 family)
VIELSINYFSGLDALARDLDLDFQYVRVGSWFDREAVSRAVAEFLGKRFLYHYNRNIRADEAKTQVLIATLVERQQQTNSPWLSAHLDQHTDEEIHDLLRKGRRPPRYGVEQSFEMICDATQTLKGHLPVPLLLENVEHWPLPEIDFAVLPDFIRRVLEEIECDLLLDTAHAQITARRLNWDVRSYMEALPLERVIEIHVCGTSRREGQLIDSHEALKDEDYVLLEWLLRHTVPKVITLEYSRDPAQVPDQIARLNQIISQANAES